MKKIFSISLIILSGCTTFKPTATITTPDIATSRNLIELEDLRPETEKQSETFSMLSISCAFGIDRYGDSTLEPKKTDLLRYRVYEKFKSSGNLPRKVTVHNFVTYMNGQTAFRKIGFQSGLAGAGYTYTGNPKSINDSIFGGSNIPSCEPKEVRQAYYLPTENPEDKLIFIIHLDAEIDGHRKYVRYTHPYKNNFESNKKDHIQATENAINEFLKGL